MSLNAMDLQRLSAIDDSIKEVINEINNLDSKRQQALMKLDALEKSLQEIEDRTLNNLTEASTLIQQDCIPKFLLVHSSH